MALVFEPTTESSFALAASLCKLIQEASRRTNTTKKLLQAISAVVGDLLAAAGISADLYSFRPLGKAEFEGQRVGYTPAKDTLDALAALNLIEHESGFQCGMNRYGNGQATRYRANAALLELALGYGITPSNWSMHYRYAPRPSKVVHPIIVRGKREHWHDDTKGPKLPVNRADPTYWAAAKQVQDLNAYMARQSITGCVFMGFRRIFNYGDQPGFDHNMGGRLYAIGGSYQHLPSNERAAMAINGERVIELDIRASFLTMIYGLSGEPLDPEHDPYMMAWPPRDVAKAWATMTFGYGGFQNRWSPQTKITLLKKKGIDLNDYPIERVRAAVLEQHPILKGWPDSSLRWPELQYRESCAIIDAVCALAFIHGVPALPVHDSLIVPASRLMLAKQVLESSFEREIGSRPVLTIKVNGESTSL